MLTISLSFGALSHHLNEIYYLKWKDFVRIYMLTLWIEIKDRLWSKHTKLHSRHMLWYGWRNSVRCIFCNCTYLNIVYVKIQAMRVHWDFFLKVQSLNLNSNCSNLIPLNTLYFCLVSLHFPNYLGKCSDTVGQLLGEMQQLGKCRTHYYTTVPSLHMMTLLVLYQA